MSFMHLAALTIVLCIYMKVFKDHMRLSWIARTEVMSIARMTGSATSLLKMHTTYRMTMRTKERMLTLIPNHPETPQVMYVAYTWSFSSSWLLLMNSSTLLKARIVLAPEMVSPRWLSTGDLVVDYTRTVSLIGLTVLLTRK